MTPKEKAEELFKTFRSYLGANLMFTEDADEDAKNCALIVVNEILENMMLFEEPFDAGLKIQHRYFWVEVKQEIEKL